MHDRVRFGEQEYYVVAEYFTTVPQTCYCDCNRMTQKILLGVVCRILLTHTIQNDRDVGGSV